MAKNRHFFKLFFCDRRVLALGSAWFFVIKVCFYLCSYKFIVMANALISQLLRDREREAKQGYTESNDYNLPRHLMSPTCHNFVIAMQCVLRIVSPRGVPINFPFDGVSLAGLNSSVLLAILPRLFFYHPFLF